MTDNAAGAVYDEIQKIDMFTGVKTMDFDKAVEEGLIEYVNDDVYTEYLAKLPSGISCSGTTVTSLIPISFRTLLTSLLPVPLSGV